MQKGNPIKFKSGEEMYQYLCEKGDLYNSKKRIYVFLYNDAGALANYTLWGDQEEELTKLSKECEEAWSALLGPGGIILDDTRYERGSKEYLMHSHEFCEMYYDKGNWHAMEE